MKNTHQTPSLVDSFLLQYVAWWGSYTFDGKDWTTREEIRTFLEQVPAGKLNDLLKMVAALEVKKPRLAIFYNCLDKLLSKKRDQLVERDQEVKQAKEKQEAKSREREYRAALKDYPGDCIKHKIKRHYVDGRWICWRCEAEKNRTHELIPIDRKQRSAGNKEADTIPF